MLTAGFFTALSTIAGVARAAPALNARDGSAPVNSTTCAGKSYSYNALAGYGFIPGNDRDSTGDTIGGIGSAAAIAPETWQRYSNGSYTGILYAQPDRGWNTNGTLNYNSRVQKFLIVLTPNASATVDNPSSPNLQFYYLNTTLHTDPSGQPTTGLDPTTERTFSSSYPALPIANYAGDGFGGDGPGGSRVPVDAEGLIYNPDGSFYTSDEYGPYIYKFSADGCMQAAIRPPNAFIPLRNGSDSFSADSPPIYAPNAAPSPTDPTQGRANNQGLEGMTISADGKIITVLLQSALIQEGGTSKSNNFNSRALQYDISGNTPSLVGEYVVQLPQYTRANGNTRTAAQSEIHDVGNNQFFVLSRDSGAGRAADSTTSLYRHVDIFDITNATNLAGSKTTSSNYNAFNASIASSKGKLNSGITPATYCSFLDFNVNSELGKFGLHNGGTDNSTLLNEKWESLAVVPQLDLTGAQVPGKWFVFSLSDDDFITQDGYMNGGKFKYADATGASLDNQALVFDVTLPSGAQPWRTS